MNSKRSGIYISISLFLAIGEKYVLLFSPNRIAEKICARDVAEIVIYTIICALSSLLLIRKGEEK